MPPEDTVGTGVIIDERGYIVTNRHVIGASHDIRIRLHNGTELAAELVWGEAAQDLAVLRIRPPGRLQALALAPVGDLMVGETVIAVGHPFGYTDTVSTGIVSALEREITMPSGATLTGLIQTSAGINPGNSGGPLLNINGELIGINVALRDGAQGIAFAINADTVKHVLMTHLSSVRIAGVAHGLRFEEKIVAATGRVSTSSSPRATRGKGWRKGDEIVAIGDRRIANAFDVERALWDSHAGDKVVVQVARQGKELSVHLVLSGTSEQRRLAATPRSTGRHEPPVANHSVLIADPQR